MRLSATTIACAALAVLATAPGCGGGDRPCTSMGATSDVIARAALLRLDVYDAAAHCDGATVAAGAAPPTMSKVVAAGQAIHLDVPAGRHVLLLSAFADGAGTQLVGSACTETEVRAGTPACFNLTLAAAPDLGAPPDDDGGGGGAPDLGTVGCASNADCASTPDTPLCKTDEHRCVQCLSQADCAPGKLCSPSGSCVDGCVPAAPTCPSAQMCCTDLCIDTTKDLSSCGACGRACASAHVATPACAQNLCAPVCNAGWADCNHPIAPAADDGCETNVHDVDHCGGCNTACNLPHATPDCPSGTCVVKQCAANYFDCDAKPANGCECPGTDRGGAAGGCCAGGACQTAHTDGFGHSFYDCIAAGAYSEQLARDAADAYPQAGTIDTFLQTCGGSSIFCKRGKMGGTAIGCGCWAYAGSAKGYAKQSSGECMCPSTGDQPYQ